MARQGVASERRREQAAAALVELFRLEPDEASRLAGRADIDVVRANAVIAGDAVVVVRGALALTSNDVLLDVARAPLVALRGPWSYLALRACVVARWPRATFAPHHAALLRAHETFASSLAERIEARAAPSAEARLERLLSDLAKRFGTRVSGGTFIALPLRGRDAGALVGATTETVARIFAAWKRAGRMRKTHDGIWLAG